MKEKNKELIEIRRSTFDLILQLVFFIIIFWFLFEKHPYIKYFCILIILPIVYLHDKRSVLLSNEGFTYKSIWKKKLNIRLESIKQVTIETNWTKKIQYYITINYIIDNQQKKFGYSFDGVETCLEINEFLKSRNINCILDGFKKG